MTETLLQTLFISYRKPINSVKGTRQGRKAGDQRAHSDAEGAVLDSVPQQNQY